MKFIALLLLSVALVGAFESKFINHEAPHAVDDQYIVMFYQNSTQDDQLTHLQDLVGLFAMDSSFQNELLHTYDFADFHGYAARLSKKLVIFALSSDVVEFVERDTIVKAIGGTPQPEACATQNNAVWGLDRISEVQLNLDGVYNYPSTAGSGVDSYVVDTGILITHQDFGSRAIWGANFADSQNTDCNGHGTHVAGTMGGTTYGVAKKTTLIAVKVLTCSGSGTNAGVIAGINWVVTSYQSRKRPSVANMSLGGPASTATDTAVANGVKAGVTFVVAAGNDNSNACNYSPARVATAITVGATGVEDVNNVEVDMRTSFSNYGSCVSIFAPGLMITSDWIGSNTATLTISGTSMASPHVAGVSALYLGAFGSATPANVKSYITSEGTNGLIDLDCASSGSSTQCKQSPNILLYSAC